MALKHKQLLHRIATWVATSPELNSATDGLVMWAVWRKYQGQIEKRDLPFIVDRLIRTLREMVKLDALEAASNGKPTFHLPTRRRRQIIGAECVVVKVRHFMLQPRDESSLKKRNIRLGIPYAN